MRIRKGARCVVPTDRPCVHIKGFTLGKGNAPREGDAGQPPVPEAGVVAATIHGCSEDLAIENGMSSAGTERLEDDRVRKRLSGNGRSRNRPPIAEGVISISSIIEAGVKPAPKRNSTSAPASGKSDVTSVASLAKSPTDCCPSNAEKITIDRPNLLLQSLKKITAAEITGLTAKGAVAKILQQGLPGLIEGGERLIVQVAKLFRSSYAFVERKERGRYFIQESFQELMGWGNLQTGDADLKGEKAVPTGATAESEKAIEAATQLAKVQSIKLEPVHERVGFTKRVGKPGIGHWVLALRAGKSDEKIKSTSKKRSPQWDPETGVLRCNREDGRGWTCFRLAESGFSSCKYHRELSRIADSRRRKKKRESDKRRTNHMASSPVSSPVEPEKPSNPTLEGGKTVYANSYESDNKLPDRKRRRFVKAKSLKSLNFD